MYYLLGADIRAYYVPLRLNKVTKLHAKVAIFDNQTVVTGSMNWAGKLGDNIELLVLVGYFYCFQVCVHVIVNIVKCCDIVKLHVA